MPTPLRVFKRTESIAVVNRCKLYAVVALIVAVSAGRARAAHSFTDFTVPGAADTVLNNINNMGQVVGVYGAEINPLQGLTPGWNGFVSNVDGSALTTLTPHPDALGVEAAAVNDSGVVVGTFSLDLGGFEAFRGFVYDGTDYTVLEVPFETANDTLVANIDDAGVVYGAWAEDLLIGIDAQRTSGFRATPDGQGGYTYENVDLGSANPLLISNTFLNGRNAAGQEIATLRRQGLDPQTFEVVNEVLGVLLPNTDIEYPGAGATRAVDINDAGDIVGVATFAEEVEPEVFEFYEVGFSVNANDLLAGEPTAYTDLMIPGRDNRFGQDLTGVEPNGHSGVQSINNQGALVGFYDNDDGIYRGFIGTPDVSLSGDYNQDGSVDAADYTVWRDGDSSLSGQPGYDAWAAGYGGTAPQLSQPTPEPCSLGMLSWALASLITGRRSHKATLQ